MSTFEYGLIITAGVVVGAAIIRKIFIKSNVSESTQVSEPPLPSSLPNLGLQPSQGGKKNGKTKRKFKNKSIKK